MLSVCRAQDLHVHLDQPAVNASLSKQAATACAHAPAPRPCTRQNGCLDLACKQTLGMSRLLCTPSNTARG